MAFLEIIKKKLAILTALSFFLTLITFITTFYAVSK